MKAPLAKSMRALALLGASVVVACAKHHEPITRAAMLRPYLTELISSRADEFDSSGNFRSPSPHSPIASILFANILKTETPVGDSAVAYLLYVRNADNSGDDLVCEIAARGDRLVPLIELYASALPPTGLEPLPKGILGTGVLVPDAMAMIHKGERCNSE